MNVKEIDKVNNFMDVESLPDKSKTPKGKSLRNNMVVNMCVMQETISTQISKLNGQRNWKESQLSEQCKVNNMPIRFKIHFKLLIQMQIFFLRKSRCKEHFFPFKWRWCLITLCTARLIHLESCFIPQMQMPDTPNSTRLAQMSQIE